VRLLIGQHSGSSWASGSTAVVTVYNGPPGGVASAVTVVAYNHYVRFASDTNCTNRWVALGHNGFGWVPVDSRSDCGTCMTEAGGVDFRVFPGYSRTTEQVLGHDTSGCIKWFSTTTCATAS
jgi:transglutaminase-like putative cysteine protease